MIRHSDSIAAIAKALAEAQGDMENAAKNAKNPHFKSNYADLAEILNTVRPVLSRHGIAVVQSPSYEAGEVHLATMLIHASGEWIGGLAAAPATKQDPQGVGSAVTYLRRYSLAAFCGIAQEDDDGNAASNGRPPGRREQAPPAPVEQPATEKQVELIVKMSGSHVITEKERASLARRLDDGMTKVQAIGAIDWLTKTVKDRTAIEKAEAEESAAEAAA